MILMASVHGRLGVPEPVGAGRVESEHRVCGAGAGGLLGRSAAVPETGDRDGHGAAEADQADGAGDERRLDGGIHATAAWSRIRPGCAASFRQLTAEPGTSHGRRMCRGRPRVYARRHGHLARCLCGITRLQCWGVGVSTDRLPGDEDDGQRDRRAEQDHQHGQDHGDQPAQAKAPAETRSREEYADDVRSAGWGDQPAGQDRDGRDGGDRAAGGGHGLGNGDASEGADRAPGTGGAGSENGHRGEHERPQETRDPGDAAGGREPAEPRSREDYADEARAYGEPLPPGGDGAQASDLDDGRAEQPAGGSAGGGLAEPRDRETYADAMRAEAGGAGLDSMDTVDDQAPAAFDAPAWTGEADRDAAEPLSRDEYGDAVREGGLDGSQHAGAADIDQAEATGLQRQDVAETNPVAAETGQDHEQVSDRPDDQASGEHPATGQFAPPGHHLADAERAPEPGSAETAPAEHQQGEGAAEHGGEGERAAGPGQEHPGDAGKARDFVVMVGEHPVHVVEADRTLDDDKPTGIGRKPTGDELRDMDSERTSAEDAFRKVLYKRADDITDVLEKDANQVKDILSPPRPTGQREGTAPQLGPAAPEHGIDAGNLAILGVVVGLMSDRVIRWGVEQWRKQRG